MKVKRTIKDLGKEVQIRRAASFLHGPSDIAITAIKADQTEKKNSAGSELCRHFITDIFVPPWCVTSIKGIFIGNVCHHMTPILTLLV